MNQDEILKALTNIVRRAFPELGEGTHLPHKARVVALHGEPGTVRADGLGTRRYSVDVEPLTPDGEPDDSRPHLLDVPLEVAWTGDGRGVFGLPAVGSVVRVCYYGGSAAHPYIDGIVPDGHRVPAVADGEYLIHHSDQVQVRIRPDGSIHIVSDQPVTIDSQAAVTVSSAVSVAVDAPLVTLAGGGPAVARVGDAVDPVSHLIVSGSGKVFSG